MWKKFNTDCLTWRLRKILQADENISEIATATPILISRAAEIFLQDLCKRTCTITLNRGAKVLSSLHLKECIGRHSALAFLYKIVSHIPVFKYDIGGENAHQWKKYEGDHGGSSDDEDAKLATGESEPTNREEMGRHGRGQLQRGRDQQDGGQRSNEGWSTEHVPFSLVRRQHELFNFIAKLSENGKGQQDGGQRSNEGWSTEHVPPSLVRKQSKDFNLNVKLDENGKGQHDGGQRSNEGWSTEHVPPSLVRRQPKDFDLNVKLDENGEPQPQPHPPPQI